MIITGSSRDLLQLGRNFDTSGLDEFPTKRVFSLTTAQLDERRAGLERYLHSGRSHLGMEAF